MKLPTREDLITRGLKRVVCINPECLSNIKLRKKTRTMLMCIDRGGPYAPTLMDNGKPYPVFTCPHCHNDTIEDYKE